MPWWSSSGSTAAGTSPCPRCHPAREEHLVRQRLDLDVRGRCGPCFLEVLPSVTTSPVTSWTPARAPSAAPTSQTARSRTSITEVGRSVRAGTTTARPLAAARANRHGSSRNVRCGRPVRRRVRPGRSRRARAEGSRTHVRTPPWQRRTRRGRGRLDTAACSSAPRSAWERRRSRSTRRRTVGDGSRSRAARRTCPGCGRRRRPRPIARWRPGQGVVAVPVGRTSRARSGRRAACDARHVVPASRAYCTTVRRARRCHEDEDALQSSLHRARGSRGSSQRIGLGGRKVGAWTRRRTRQRRCYSGDVAGARAHALVRVLLRSSRRTDQSIMTGLRGRPCSTRRGLAREARSWSSRPRTTTASRQTRLPCSISTAAVTRTWSDRLGVPLRTSFSEHERGGDLVDDVGRRTRRASLITETDSTSPMSSALGGSRTGARQGARILIDEVQFLRAARGVDPLRPSATAITFVGAGLPQ